MPEGKHKTVERSVKDTGSIRRLRGSDRALSAYYEGVIIKAL